MWFGRRSMLLLGLLWLLIALPGVAIDKWTQQLWDSLSYKSIDLDAFRSALTSGANPNWAEASQYGSTSVLSRAVDLAAEVERAGEPNSSYPADAMEAVRALLKAGAKLQASDVDILYGPIYWGNLELTRLLIQAGASPQKFSYRSGNITPIELAVKKSRAPVVDFLVSLGVPTPDKATTLQLQLVDACSLGKTKDVRRLIESGADINRATRQGETPLGSALDFPIFELEAFLKIMYLLDRGADVNQISTPRTGDPRVPLSTFIYNSSFTFSSTSADTTASEVVFHELILRGAAVSSVDGLGMTPLHYAAEYNNLFAAKLLLASGAKVMPKDKSGKTPLDYAEYGPMIQLLKDNGARE